METVSLFGIGLAALGYVLYLVWRSINGKAACNCGGSCQEGENCHCKSKIPK
jgi:hypothetical protein